MLFLGVGRKRDGRTDGRTEKKGRKRDGRSDGRTEKRVENVTDGRTEKMVTIGRTNVKLFSKVG